MRMMRAGLGGVLAMAGVALASPVLAESKPGYEAPKTAWGAPDLQGFWNNTSLTEMTRPRTAEKLVVNEQELAELVQKNRYTLLSAQQEGRSDLEDDLLTDGNNDAGYNVFWIDPGTTYAKVKGEYRTSWIVDPPSGNIPYRAIDPRGERMSPVNFDGPETRPLAERCIINPRSPGPVMQNGMYNNTVQIVQSPTHVMILVEMMHDARVIPINADHQPDVIQKWAGDSIGWYEGDTLVVETRNPNPVQRSLITSAGKVTERFSRWSQDQILYQFTVEDPTLYEQPWSGEMALNPGGKLYEFACHEGNYAMHGILGGARRIEADGGTPSLGPGIFSGVIAPE